MAALVDTNILVYRFDPRFPEKQAVAAELLRAGIADDSIRVPHQALIEFVAATTRPLTRGGRSILAADDARREMEEMLVQFEVLYPDEELVRIAITGCRDVRTLMVRRASMGLRGTIRPGHALVGRLRERQALRSRADERSVRRRSLAATRSRFDDRDQLGGAITSCASSCRGISPSHASSCSSWMKWLSSCARSSRCSLAHA